MAGQMTYLQLMQSIENPDPVLFSRGCYEVGETSGVENFMQEKHPSASEEQSPLSPASHPGSYDSGVDAIAEDVYTTDDDWNTSNNPEGAGRQLNYADVSADKTHNEDVSDDEPDNHEYYSYMLPLVDTSSDEDEVNAEPETDCQVFQPPEVETVFERNEAEHMPLYKKRRRHKKGEILPSSRLSIGMGPVEIALRGASERKTKYIFEPVVGTCFDSAAEAYEFYNLYSWEKGFGISYGRSDTNRGNQYRTMQELQCSNQGKDKRILFQTQRCGCRAVVRLLRTDDHGWYISKFDGEHNHEMSESYGEKMQWGSHRRIDESAKNMIKFLRDNNVPLGKCHSIMGSVYGSVQELPFTKRSLRTLCQLLAREQMDDDVKKTLEIFRNLRKEDPDFCYSVDVDKHNRIKTLIWTNHRSKMQYQCFGDVFTFDTTFCTNIYKMPFGLFVGVNNHFQSVIFAGVLMRKETIKSFTWVFNEFLSLMGGKAPTTILTDQAKAMIPAVEKSMPNTTHLWCKWHVLRKAQESLGPVYSKHSAFRQEFHKVLNEMLTMDEFEAAWEILITKYKLKKNTFMIRIYECRDMWAKPYSREKFCARMMSTQRGESANHMLKTYVRGNSTMNNFVSKYNDMIFDRAMEEDREEQKTKNVKKYGKRMWPIQNHAYKIYTRASYKLFTIELEKSYHYIIDQDGSQGYMTVKYAYSALREPWVRVSFKVTISEEGDLFECECGLFTHFGILCCHAIRALLHLGVAKIPQRYILKRWTRDARDILPANLRYLQKDSRAMTSHTCRDNLLYGTAMKAVKEGNRDFETFTEMMKHFVNGLKAVGEIISARGEQIPEKPDPLYESSDNEWQRGQHTVCDSETDDGLHGKTLYSHERVGAVPSNFDLSTLKAPLVEKQKSGRPRVKRFLSPIEGKSKGKKKASASTSKTQKSIKQTSFCGLCRLPGHRRNNCPQNPEAGIKKKKKPCSTTCQLPGHNASNCYSFIQDVDEFDIGDLNGEQVED